MKGFQRTVLVALACVALAAMAGDRAVGVADDIKSVEVVNTPTVKVQRTVLSDGVYFEIDAFDPDPEFTVPAGVVLTDAHVTFSVPAPVPNAAAIYVSDGAKTYYYRIVNNTTFEAGLDLEGGILSNGGLKVKLSCYNISGNHCQGALMWSGYRP
jgi:hypothetical protein